MKEYTFGKKAAVVVIHQMFMVLSITSLFIMDFFVGRRPSGNGMIYSVFSIIGLVGTFVALAYLTNVTGKASEEDSNIYFNLIDRIYSDILTLLFILFIWGITHMTMRFRHQTFTIAGLLVAVGTLSYILDTGFLVFYLSIVRRVKGDILLTQSMIYKIYLFFRKMIQKDPQTPYIFPFRRNVEQMQIQEAIEAIAAGALDTKLNVGEFHGQERKMAEAVNQIREGLSEAVLESIRNERMKADLITNVSHDIKTPLTSIVNYVDLLKRENLENENARNYIRILDEKSQRLKHLTEDLVEASKISSGNVHLDMQKIDFVELIYQTGGEYNEKFEARDLTIVTKLPHQSVMIYADGRQLYRTIENLYTNAAKYALEKTRVYVELALAGDQAVFSIKNISRNQISLDRENGNDLTERFVRGEVSRTTEGSGLGLSIAKNLTLLMGGDFEIQADGDLFIAMISFKIA